MLRCAQMHRDHFPVRSSSTTAHKTYTVRMFREDELPTCTCTGFMTKRNRNANLAGGGFPGAGAGLARTTPAWCKHLEEVKRTTCDWQQAPGEPAPASCPRCGGPVVETDAPLLPAGRGPVSSDEAQRRAPAPADPPKSTPPVEPVATTEPLDADAAADELAKLLEGA